MSHGWDSAGWACGACGAGVAGVSWRIVYKCVRMNELQCQYHARVLRLLFVSCFNGLDAFTCTCILQILQLTSVKYLFESYRLQRLIQFL